MVATRTLFVPFVIAAGALSAAVIDTTTGKEITTIFGRADIPELDPIVAEAPECKSSCDAFQNNVKGCTTGDGQCLCTDDKASSLGGCLSCFAHHANNATSTTQLQGVMDSYIALCKADNITLKSQTIKSNGAMSAHSIGASVMGLVVAGVFFSL
ncbi:hypothetical protein L218DRAFT_1043742 [Marasmius fiardii PR-910]|nr:hypothetical protein L218DRAFT_1043742 [Marasmius fiardii PR-910]